MARTIPTMAVLAALSLAACAAEDAITPPSASDADQHSASHDRRPERTASLGRQLAELRQATARFHNHRKATEAGYSIEVTPCWAHRTQGAMGYHFGKVDPSEWDTSVSLLEPELLMYEPGPGGQMRLVGMEYVVPKDAWDAASPEVPPTLLGKSFHPHSILPIYKLHIWLWRDNPRGLFADWNPKVSCANASEVTIFE